MEDGASRKKRNSLSCIALALGFLCARTLLAVPFALPMGGLSFWVRLSLRIALCLAVALFACGPERVFRANRLAALAGGTEPEAFFYASGVRNAARRIARTLPFSLPFTVSCALIFYCVFDNASNLKALRLLKQIGDFLKSLVSAGAGAPGYDVGCAALLVAGAVFLTLWAVFWHRDVPEDYGLDSREIRRRDPALWRRTTLFNLALGLPAWALACALSLLTLRRLYRDSGSGLLSALLSLPDTVSEMLRQREWIALMAVCLAAVYIPCWIIRKRNLTACCLKGDARNEA